MPQVDGYRDERTRFEQIRQFLERGRIGRSALKTRAIVAHGNCALPNAVALAVDESQIRQSTEQRLGNFVVDALTTYGVLPPRAVNLTQQVAFRLRVTHYRDASVGAVIGA